MERPHIVCTKTRSSNSPPKNDAPYFNKAWFCSEDNKVASANSSDRLSAAVFVAERPVLGVCDDDNGTVLRPCQLCTVIRVFWATSLPLASTKTWACTPLILLFTIPTTVLVNGSKWISKKAASTTGTFRRKRRIPPKVRSTAQPSRGLIACKCPKATSLDSVML